MARRDETWLADKGRCVGCSKRLRRRGAPVFEWDSHHVIAAQVLRRERAPSKYVRTALVCVLLCRRCHERHTSGMERVPFERLPPRVVEAAAELGEWAVARLEREHPRAT
jgi:hypothetical protein